MTKLVSMPVPSQDSTGLSAGCSLLPSQLPAAHSPAAATNSPDGDASHTRQLRRYLRNRCISCTTCTYTSKQHHATRQRCRFAITVYTAGIAIRQW